MIAPFIAITLQIATPTQFVRHLPRIIFLGWVEGDDPDRIAVLSSKKVLDNLQISHLVVGLHPGAAETSATR